MRDIAVELGLDADRESDIEEFTKDAKLTENHRLIAMLPIKTVWTTNYDQLLEQAYRETRKRT